MRRWLEVQRPNCSWQISHDNYCIASHLLDYRIQCDSYSCGFYILSAVLSFASWKYSGFPDVCFRKDSVADSFAVADMTETLREACTRLTAYNSLQVWNIVSRTPQKFLFGLRIGTDARWPSKMNYGGHISGPIIIEDEHEGIRSGSRAVIDGAISKGE